jgi:hypothetical protein
VLRPRPIRASAARDVPSMDRAFHAHDRDEDVCQAGVSKS